MVDSSGGYREKYRRALAEQERMEKQFKFQLDALSKTISHLGAVSQGQDPQLDASLMSLKEKLRGASGTEVLEQMNRVQTAATAFEKSRRAGGLSSAKHISDIVEQLSVLKIPNPVAVSLKSFSAGLEKRLEAQRYYPDVLDELSKLHQLAIEAAANPPSTFWGRLKGGRTLQPKPAQSKNTSATTLDRGSAKAALNDEDAFDSADIDLTPSDENPIDRFEDVGQFEPGDEESYDEVAQRIARTLDGLVARIEPNDVVRHKIDIVRLRIKRGMDWYALAVTLEDVRDILLLRYLQSDQEFSDYLKRVNEELASIRLVLGLAADQEGEVHAAGASFSRQVAKEVDNIRESVAGSGTIDELKSAVSDHLSTIQDALGDFDSHQQNAASISGKLKTLVDRVKNIEDESQKTKELLEEERHRATHDALTGLPNREAYNERAYHELLRFKRYCRPLTLAVCDIDFFKKINDGYGHQVGDKVLKLIGKLIFTRLRNVDFVARYGGEEFVVIMPETSAQQALPVLDKIRAVMARTPFKFKGDPVTITMSFGLANFVSDDSVESVFERADKALYQAKATGRNKCIVAEHVETSSDSERNKA